MERRTGQLELPDPVQPTPDEPMIPDERLELIFTCCHPALGTEAQVALTLRALGGLTTPEIARAFMVPDETMKRRLSRARTKIKTAGIPFEIPADHVLPNRLRTVLAVVYLIFNQGYSDDGRGDLAEEAIRLGRVLVDLVPDEGEAAALLALMLLHDARHGARVCDGEIVPLHEQDRSLWDGGQIAAGCALVERAVALRGRGPYTVQAAIAAEQVQTPIDWLAVVGLYGRLGELTRSPIVALNRAVAVAELDGPLAALEIVDALRLGDYRYLHSTRAELLRRLGDRDAAGDAYERALALAVTDPERRFLERRLREL